MPKVTIDGRTIEVPDGTNLVRAAELADIEIPHYCYHPGLTVAGNCRMCLVDIRAMSAKQATPLPKLQIACNTIVQDGMVVEASNEKVQQARKAVLEFLLINHPIDCPICDQAGECKLQEYYMDYGRYQSRVQLEQKVHKGKVIPVGADIMLDQERCILCTRCVRFLDEFTEDARAHDHGARRSLRADARARRDGRQSVLGQRRGHLPGRRAHEPRVPLPGACLVPRRGEVHLRGCATGCNIDVHYRGDEIYRLKPRLNPDVNGYWMCDEGRRTYRANRAPERLRSSLTREASGFVDLDADAVAERAAASLHAARKPAVVASADLTMEEGFLVSEILERIGGGERIVISPAVSLIPGDDKLISTDRHPNRRGLLALGFREAAKPAAEIDAAIVVRCDPVSADPAWAVLFEGLVATIVVSERVDETTGYADHVLGVATHFESSGSFMNRAGRMQHFEPAVAPPGRAVEGWRALADVLAALGGPHHESVESVLAALLARLTSREGLGAQWLGAFGRDLTT
jgi:NADH-quinone oxidoreductase subunit G